MSENRAIFLICLALIALLAIAIIFNRGEASALVADLVKVAVSGYIGYLRGTSSK